MRIQRFCAALVAAFMALALTACGGGSDAPVSPTPTNPTPTDPTATAPSITAQPAELSVVAPNPASFSVTATGTAPLTYQWKKDGMDISGANSSSYTTPGTAIGDKTAVFTVVVSNSVKSVTSNPATLTVTPGPVAPTISSQPADQSVVAPAPASFSVTATGTEPFTYQWKRNGNNISGATASTYTTPATTTNDNGAVFTVVVSNGIGNPVTSNPGNAHRDPWAGGTQH